MTMPKMEREIIKAAIKGLLDAGYKISVFDSEETVLEPTSDGDAVFAELYATDCEYLITHRQDGQACGHVFLVYGNDGYDVISDYTTNLEVALKAANELGEKYDAEQ